MTPHPVVSLNPSKKSNLNMISIRPNKRSDKLLDQHDFIFKIVMIGDAAVGKSTLLERYIDKVFKSDPEYISTIGVDFKIKAAVIDSTLVQKNGTTSKVSYSCKLQIWDTAGQERFKSITQSYYRTGSIFIVCFDASLYGGSGSKESVLKWINDIDALCGGDNLYSIYVLGTRMDQISQHEVEYAIGADLPRYVEYWESSFENRHIRFVGLCSSKKDQFIERSKILDKETLKLATNEIISKERDANKINSDILPIHAMFEYIVKDHIEHYTDSSLDIPQKNNVVILDNSAIGKQFQSQGCCGIL